MAGTAAIVGFAAAAAEIRRRLTTRARVSRRLAWMHGAKSGHFQFQAQSLVSGLAKDIDLA